MYIYMNGKVDHYKNISISPLDHGFLYGLGLFETFRTYDGHPFLLDDHFRRLEKSGGSLNIELPEYDRDDIVRIINELLKVNDLDDGYFRWNVSAGENNIGLYTGVYEEPNTIVYVKPLPDTKLLEKKGIILQQRRNTPEGPYRLKSHHYLNNIIGKREVGNKPELEGIFLTEQGDISEGVVSNLFWWKKDTLFTPSVEAGGLDGITKRFVITLAKKLNLAVKEGIYSLESMMGAEEVFITNSIQEIVPLSSVNDTIFQGKDGSVCNLLMKHYAKYKKSVWSACEINLGKGDEAHDSKNNME